MTRPSEIRVLTNTVNRKATISPSVSGKMAGDHKLVKSTFHHLDPPKTPISPPNRWSNRAENQYDPVEGLAQVRAEVRYRRQYDLAEIRCVGWPKASS